MRLAVILLALCAIAPAQFVRPPYALTNAKVVIAPGKTLGNATILVRDGLIEAVGENLPVPADTRIYDAKGLTVYPGLIDAATNYGFPVIARTPTLVPVTGALTGSTVPGDIASPDRYLRPQPTGVNPDTSAALKMTMPATPDPRRTYGFTTVLAIPREGHWQGTSALVNLRPGPPSEAVVLSPVAMHVNFTLAGFGAGGGARYPTSLMGVFAILRQSLTRAQQYRDSIRLYESLGKKGVPRPAFDPVSAALLPVLDGTIPVVFAADNAESIRRAIRFSDEFKLRPIIVGGVEASRVADLLKSRNISVLVSLALQPAAVGRSMFQAAEAATEPPPNGPSRIAAEENPAKLEKAGVRWAFVSGTWDRPEQIRMKVRAAISRGLSPEAALKALTVSPAEILGASAQLGTIEKGKIANLALSDGDILEPRSRVRAVMIDGQLIFPSSSGLSGGRTFVSSNGAAGQSAAPVTTPGDDPTPPAPSRRTQVAVTASPIPDRRPPNPEPAPRDLVIRNATILTVTKGTIQNGSLWVHEGKIQEVGTTVKAPADAKVIDGNGRFIMPGMIDSHSHSAISGGVNEGGPSVTAQCRITDVLNPEDINLYRAAAAGVTTLNVLHGSANAIGGQNATIKLKWGSPVEQMIFPGAPAGVKMALGENPRRVNSSSARGNRFPATRMGVENVIRESFKAAREYKAAWDDYEARTARGEKLMPPERNLTLDTLRGVLEGKVLVHAHCYRADEISMLLDLADEYGFKIRSLQHVLEGYKVTDKIKKHGAGASTFADNWGYKMEAFDGTAYNTALMVKAGIHTAVNSDSDERARRLYQEAAKAIKYGGVTEEQALKLITTEPAWMLGIEKRVGALEPGMDADIAVFNAHPFSPYARVEMTLVDGQIVFDRERDLRSRVEWKEEFEAEATPSSDTALEDEDYR